MRIVSAAASKTLGEVVLILVFGEDMRIVDYVSTREIGSDLSLNPCFWGRYADRIRGLEEFEGNTYCLNPCFWGRYADSRYCCSSWG